MLGHDGLFKEKSAHTPSMALAPPVVSNDFPKLIDWISKEQGNGGITVWESMRHFADRRKELKDYFHHSVYFINNQPYCPVLYDDWSMLLQAGVLKIEEIKPPLIHYSIDPSRLRIFRVHPER